MCTKALCLFGLSIAIVSSSPSVSFGVNNNNSVSLIRRVSVDGTPMLSVNTTTPDPLWLFMAIVMVPEMSCDSIAKLAHLFNTALQQVNPLVGRMVSTAVRLGGDVCIDGNCFCDESIEAPHSVRVLELSTSCAASTLLLPSMDEFPFEFDMRSDVPLYPTGKD
jgi:hypothetical protein